MSYSDGEALALTIVRDHANFDSDNSARGDWQMLSDGKSDHYAILRPGPFSRELMTDTTMLGNWTTVIELWQIVSDGLRSTALTTLEGYAMDLIDQFDANNRMGDSANVVVDAQIGSGGDVLEIDRGGGSLWLKWELNVEWQEELSVSFSD